MKFKKSKWLNINVYNLNLVTQFPMPFVQSYKHKSCNLNVCSDIFSEDVSVYLMSNDAFFIFWSHINILGKSASL